MNNGVQFETDGPLTGTDAREAHPTPPESIGERWRRRWRSLKRGVRNFLILVLLLIVCLIFRHRIFVSVDSGDVLVVYYRFFGGTSHNKIGHEGLHFLAPWDRAYIYTVRTQTMLQPMTVLSKNALEVRLDAQIRFHVIPEIVPYLHRRYGEDYKKSIIVPQLTESVQQLIGQYQPEELYSSDTGASATQIFENAKRVIGGVFVVVEDIALFNVKLPDKVQAAVQEKAAIEQQALSHVYLVQKERLEKDRMLLNAQGLRAYAEAVQGIPKSVLIWKGIEATLELSKSPNSKIIVMGSRDNLPLLLGNVPDLAEK